MTRFKRYLSLDPVDRKLLRGAVWRLLLAWLALRVLPFSLIMRTLRIRAGGQTGVTHQMSLRIARAVQIAARNLPLTLTCLPQGLAACWMLQGYGAAPQLHYGTQAVGAGRFSAHVWVELDGMGVIGHSAASDFVTLAVFPGVQG